ncbi:hypothetical protein B0T22DRAFT_103218 [Podospora appendiculata]|uniref:Uncharacterized protein n=1 Tax=Podospora appendiculata TaxID=314037 RepID=A0AAE0XL02_9PEZI|nr:hypothetical protein B0T22DRAFT_103218 [Podospora appendiculata]
MTARISLFPRGRRLGGGFFGGGGPALQRLHSIRVVVESHRISALSTTRISQNVTNNCVSIVLKPSNSSKAKNGRGQTVLQDLTSEAIGEAGLFAGPVGRSNAAVIISSKQYASWLDDDAFVSRLLAPLRDAASHETSPATELSILSAVVDGIPQNEVGSPRSGEGIAILRGNLDVLLPGLWKTAVAGLQSNSDGGAQPSIEFHVPSLRDDSRPLQVTVPLANTIFNTGRSHTLFASRWQIGPGAQPRLIALIEKSSQVIVPGKVSAGTSSVAVPLVPVTEARKIVTGLGNILRQVEIDGKPTPASKELETVIPMLLQARAEESGEQPTGPMGVWALIYPEHVATSQNLQRVLQVSTSSSSRERKKAREVSGCISTLLAAGCHIRRVLSGGGGWGLKQGLLSLDPQTRYSTPDQEDVESFIRSFNGEDSGGGIVTPGSYVQFLVAPSHIAAGETLLTPESEVDGDSTRVIVGTQEAEAEAADLGDVDMTIDSELFGAISSQGIYVASLGDAADGGVEHAAITTKIDSPDSFVVSDV